MGELPFYFCSLLKIQGNLFLFNLQLEIILKVMLIRDQQVPTEMYRILTKKYLKTTCKVIRERYYQLVTDMQNDIWEELKQKLPFSKSPQDTQKRAKFWSGFDVNGNGYLSLAEVDKGMQDVIRLPVLFDTKPVIMRAFTSAKTKLKAKTKYGDDYVSKAEFRFLLLYLRQYYEYWVAFKRLDDNDDRRVSVDEFIAGKDMMTKWGINMDDPKAAFKDADKDGQGMILFVEFCQWAIEKNLDLEDDDDYV